MSDFESRIRAAFHGREGDAPAFDLSDVRHIAGRTRRRQILNAAGAGLGALAVVVALAGLGGLVRADRTSTPLDAPSPSPSPARGFTTFSSALHEITIDYPAGWKVRPATEPWSFGRLTFDASDVDVIFDPTRGDDVYLALASKPLGGLSREGWLDNPWRPGICAETERAGAGGINFDGARRYWTVSCNGGGSSSAGGHTCGSPLPRAATSSTSMSRTKTPSTKPTTWTSSTACSRQPNSSNRDPIGGSS